MSLKVCAHHGCPELSEQRWCDTHRPKRPKDQRPSAWQRGYNAKWQRTRAAFLREHPLCAACGAKATEVDHKDGLGPLGPHGHDPLALIQYCRPCHSRKTALHDGSFGRPRTER
jgi:5-methylcytosine-specific restriction enzyme A